MNQTLYNNDFYAWTRQQAALLQAEEFEELDLPNLIGELESMGNSQRTEITSRLTVLLMHLLKWQFQPEHQSRSGANTIRVQRLDVEEVLEDNPSLRREVSTFIAKAYTRACRKALAKTGLLRAPWPNTCPWTAGQILDEEWLPAVAAK